MTLLSRLFPFFEALGFHVTRNHFYEPIPDLKRLKNELWDTKSELVGINLNLEKQLKLLQAFSRYKQEYYAFTQSEGNQCYLTNGSFESVDAEALYCMVRHFKPHRIIEIGSGYSTKLCSKAILKNLQNNDECTLTVIDPYADASAILASTGPFVRVLPEEVQVVPFATFDCLSENDILFIDSSHVLRTGGDVKYLYLEVIPRLSKGVFIHAHDIFLPAEYPKSWILNDHRFWTEQYLLQAFLAFNNNFNVVWAGNYMYQNHSEKLRDAFSSYDLIPKVGPGSFWMQRKPSDTVQV